MFPALDTAHSVVEVFFSNYFHFSWFDLCVGGDICLANTPIMHSFIGEFTVHPAPPPPPPPLPMPWLLLLVVVVLVVA